jgi:hypothetical protein
MGFPQAISFSAREVLVGFVTAALCFVLGATFRPGSAGERPITAISSGTELVLVFMASSTCAGVKNPALPAAVNAIEKSLRMQAAGEGKRLVTIGVSLDWQIDAGMELLNRFGTFDEVSIGRGWLNLAAIRYIWRDIPGAASVPQVVLLEREVASGETIVVQSERIRFRKVGAIPIIEWARGIEARASL